MNKSYALVNKNQKIVNMMLILETEIKKNMNQHNRLCIPTLYLNKFHQP